MVYRCVVFDGLKNVISPKIQIPTKYILPHKKQNANSFFLFFKKEKAAQNLQKSH